MVPGFIRNKKILAICVGRFVKLLDYGMSLVLWFYFVPLHHCIIGLMYYALCECICTVN